MSLIRVVSYNIHKGRSALGRRESLNDLRLGLYGLRPDLGLPAGGPGTQRGILGPARPARIAGRPLRLQAAYGRNAIRTGTDLRQCLAVAL